MGTGPSSQRMDVDNIKEHINKIASQYADNALNDDKSSLLDPVKCDNMVILGQDAIKKLFDHVIVEGKHPHPVMISDKETLLAGVSRRPSESSRTVTNAVKVGNEWFTRDPTPVPKNETSKSTYILKGKKQECVDLAEPYVKLFHLVAAIRYTLVDDTGKSQTISSNILDPNRDSEYNVNKIKRGVMKKMTPTTTPPTTPPLRNMCSTRLKELRGLMRSDSDSKNAMPLDINSTDTLKLAKDSANKAPNYLPDILSALYPSTYEDGKIINASSEQMKQSIDLFLRTYRGDNYVGNNTMETFSDIQLNNYDDMSLDSNFPGDTIKFPTKGYPFGEENAMVSWNDSLKNYALHLRKAEESHVKSAMELLKTLNSFFDDGLQIKKQMISRASMDVALESTRRIIITMEATCEKNFETTLSMYKQLIELKKIIIENERADEPELVPDTVSGPKPEHKPETVPPTTTH